MVAAIVVAAVTCAAASAGSPSEGPVLETMALAPSDFTRGASVARAGFLAATPPVTVKYARYFRPGARLGGQRFLSVACIVDLLGDQGTAAFGFSGLQALFGTSAGRQAFTQELKSEVSTSSGGTVRVRSVRYGRMVPIKVGQQAFVVKLRLRTNIGPIEAALDAVLLDQAIGLVNLDSYPRKHVRGSTAVLAARKLERRFELAFAIRDVTPPTISGTAQRGATLTADRGRWAGGPSSFTYQWNHCTSAGCTAIAGATGQTYVPGTADAGTTITVTVTATNSVSSSSQTSAATAAIP